jgi:hypothetical protein
MYDFICKLMQIDMPKRPTWMLSALQTAGGLGEAKLLKWIGNTCKIIAYFVPQEAVYHHSQAPKMDIQSLN